MLQHYMHLRYEAVQPARIVLGQKEYLSRYYRMERSSQYVRRTVRMPASADLDHMKARYEDGVLLLSMPKRQSMPDHHPVGPEQ